MILCNQEKKHPEIKNTATVMPLDCRCGGKPCKPMPIENCDNRWIIQCQVAPCYAYNIGQGLEDTLQGWNRLSTHFYR